MPRPGTSGGGGKEAEDARNPFSEGALRMNRLRDQRIWRERQKEAIEGRWEAAGLEGITGPVLPKPSRPATQHGRGQNPRGAQLQAGRGRREANLAKEEPRQPTEGRTRRQLLVEAEEDLTTALELTSEADEGWLYFMRGIVRRELEFTTEALEDFYTVLQSQQSSMVADKALKSEGIEYTQGPQESQPAAESKEAVSDSTSGAVKRSPDPLAVHEKSDEGQEMVEGASDADPSATSSAEAAAREQELAEEGWSLRAEAGYAVSQTLMSQGRIIEAVAALEDVLEASPSHVEATVHLARCRAALGDENSPLQLMSMVMRQRPEDASLLVHAGDIAALQGKSQDAVGLYSQAIHVAESMSHRGRSSARDALPGYRQRGKLSLSRGKYREALLDLRKVVNLKASGRDGVLDRDVTAAITGAVTNGEFKACVIALGPFIQRTEKAREELPSQIYTLADLYTFRGISQWYRGYPGKAREDLLAAHRLTEGKTRSLQLLYGLMIVHLQDDENALALACLEEALADAPTCAALHLIRGEVRGAVGRHEKTMPPPDCSEDFKEAYRLQPAMVDQYLRLNKLVPQLPKSSEPETTGEILDYFTLGAGATKSFIQLRPVYSWPQAPPPPALAPETDASLPWAKYFKDSDMQAFIPLVGELMPQLAIDIGDGGAPG